jgi:hypothetical protein
MSDGKLDEYLSNTAIKNVEQHLFKFSFGYEEVIDDLNIYMLLYYFSLLSPYYVCYTYYNFWTCVIQISI